MNCHQNSVTAALSSSSAQRLFLLGVQEAGVRERALKLLRTAVGSPTAEFRSGQWEAIERLLRRERLLVVERTGWGKSIVYFLATRLLRESGAGCALLISPLLALMRNQIAAARRIGVRAETINSANVDDWPAVQGALRKNEVDILLISPERLSNEDFVTHCLLPVAARVGLFVVDEAHCISDWGHDFRPDYRRIVRILRALPGNVPVLATTATANDRVVADLLSQLGPHLVAIRGPLTRESLTLQNIPMPSKAARMAWVADHVPRLPGSGIIYTLTVRDAQVLSEWLQSRAINAKAYHAQLPAPERVHLEEQLLRNEVKALVATVALGMGFDKPDLGFVIHFQRPASVVHYYQQVGRAGRALAEAYGILLCGAEDDDIADYFIHTAFPTADEVNGVLTALRESATPLKISTLGHQSNLRRGKLDKVLEFLLLESPSPIQKTENGYARNPVPWQMPKERIDRITALRRHEQDKMREYVGSRQCLMRFLSSELNDPGAGRCGKCANCRAETRLSTEVSTELAELASAFLGNVELPIYSRKMWPPGLTFEKEHGKLQEEFQLQSGRALCRWGDPGLGDLVRHGKQQSGWFSDDLADAAAKFILERWRPQPRPQWLTCVPSQRHRGLVPDFAERLALTLGLPFIECIHKVRETEPQKTRQNSYQQVRNLENGSGLVFPFALADSAIQGGE
jgi:ATP-dependent DNA helicase RecQ